MATNRHIARFRTPVAVVELGTEWLKLIRIDSGRHGPFVSGMHLERFESFGGGISVSLSKAVKRLKISKIPIIASLPRQLMTVRVLELPSTDPEEIKDMVDLQLGKHTPYSKDEVVSDYTVVGAGREGYSRVMLAIAQRSVVRQRFYVLEEVGINVDRMSVSTEGLFRWAQSAIAAKYSSGATVIVDVDSAYTDLLVLGTEGMSFGRGISIGAKDFEQGKESARATFVQEIRRSLESCRSELPSVDLARILVCGAAAGRALAERLSGDLGLPVDSMDSLADMSKNGTGSFTEDVAAQSISLTSVLGMACAGTKLEVDLTPDSVKMRKDLQRKARALTVFGMLVMTLLVCASFYAVIKVQLKGHRLEKLRKQRELLAPLAQDIEIRQRIVQIVRDHTDPRFSALSVIHEIHQAVPDGVLFEEMDVDLEVGRVRLTGSGSSRVDISTMVRNLERSSVLKDVQQEGKTENDPVSKRLKFRLVSALERSQ